MPNIALGLCVSTGSRRSMGVTMKTSIRYKYQCVQTDK
ncbi:secreted protein [marine sediment metagenome]|uniref:Secreted protein n=1 Tax=marine sediment metagenome TaxID=412755 RepID=A0A1B6NTN1_9ZZZZ